MNGLIAIIVEGEDRELRYWKAMEKVFFTEGKFVFLPLPAGQNIYMLWKKLHNEERDLDVIEIVRESSDQGKKLLKDYQRDDFQEVYLFFDCDRHQQNLSDRDMPSDEILLKMIQTFDNETENGKLYLSYPMAEALRDFVPGSCVPYSKCRIAWDECGKYKQMSGHGNSNADERKYTLQVWETLLSIFLTTIMRVFTDMKTFTIPPEVSLAA